MGQLDVPPIRVEDPARYAVARSRPRQVYSSPLTRARASAGILFPGESAHIDPQLMERSVGAWEGLDHATVRRRWPEAFRDGVIDPAVTPPGGESLQDLLDRVVGFLLSLVPEPATDVYVVTHNGWIRTAMLLTGSIDLVELFAAPVPFLEPLSLEMDRRTLESTRRQLG